MRRLWFAGHAESRIGGNDTVPKRISSRGTKIYMYIVIVFGILSLRDGPRLN